MGRSECERVGFTGGLDADVSTGTNDARHPTTYNMEEWPVAIKNARKKLGSAADDARDAVKPAAGSAMDLIGTATDKIGSVTSDALSATQDAITAAAASVGPVIEDARGKLAPYVEDAKDRISPVVEDARDRISPVVDSARDKIVPAAGVAVAAGKRRGRKAAVALRLADEPKKSHKVRNLLILLGLGGAAAFVYAKLSGKDADPAWTAGRDRAAAPTTPVAEPTTPAAESAEPPLTEPVEPPVTEADNSDVAPTAPFASEETVESDVPTTPDEPLEEKEV
jgi:hypothetical protein